MMTYTEFDLLSHVFYWVALGAMGFALWRWWKAAKSWETTAGQWQAAAEKWQAIANGKDF